ncbi:MAG: serine/threonine protein kinase, partial [Myxococcales bacterium]|nr:serine/threonine protein kinase [Myxococcales bacterium]
MPGASSQPPFVAGSVLGERFEIVGVLGQGGTAVVYDARRAPEGDRVALKVLHRHLAGDPQIRGRFAREMTILRRLQGKHLCPVLECGEIPDPRRHG